jgi:DNA (cytosine-5)-methyltransferase 1
MTDQGESLRELALFAGAGGGILGGHLLGWRCVCAVEIEDYPRRVLLARQRDGILPRFPIWDDITTFDGTPWRGRVDVISGGFPCQDISSAGKGAGITGARSGLWSHMARVISEVRPRYVFVENSPLLVSRGLDVVLADLAALGYDARWGVIGACDVGAPHKRDRIWIVADADENRSVRKIKRGNLEWGGAVRERSKKKYRPKAISDSAWPSRPEQVHNIPRMVDGLATELDKRNAAIGNGQVPGVARLAWELLA